MSPVGDAFRSRCREFPSLINCCTIDWFDRWPPEALASVATHLFANLELEEEEPKVEVVAPGAARAARALRNSDPR